MLESTPSISTTRTLAPGKSSGNPRDLTWGERERERERERGGRKKEQQPLIPELIRVLNQATTHRIYISYSSPGLLREDSVAKFNSGYYFNIDCKSLNTSPGIYFLLADFVQAFIDDRRLLDTSVYSRLALIT